MDTRYGFKNMVAGYNFETSAYDLFQVISVTWGGVRLRVRNQDIPVHPGELLLLRAGSAFDLRCESTGYRGVFVTLQDDLQPRHRGSSLRLVASPEFLQVSGLLAAELRADRGAPDPVLDSVANLFCELALRLGRTRGGGEPQEATARIWSERMRQAIDHNLYSSQGVAALFGDWELSYRQLMRHFKDAYGVTPKQYQLLSRIEQARRLLTGTSLSVTSIAMELGFPSSQHFATQFTRRIGVSPTAFRQGKQATPDRT